jgi:hypothetical protein
MNGARGERSGRERERRLEEETEGAGARGEGGKRREERKGEKIIALECR